MEEELEALALEGLNSGESMEADERFRAVKRQRLMIVTTSLRLGERQLRCKA